MAIAHGRNPVDGLKDKPQGGISSFRDLGTRHRPERLARGEDHMTDTIEDYITGKILPLAGAEENRQRVERFLVEEKGYSKQEIRVDEPITVSVGGEAFRTAIDLVVLAGTEPVMAIRCVAGSIGSFEREILAGARLVYDRQVPLSVSTDGKDALVRETPGGKAVGQGMDALPSRDEAGSLRGVPFPEKKKEREMILFRSFCLDRQHRPPMA
jgi:hypothetical protein